jgi:hypothetical protein
MNEGTRIIFLCYLNRSGSTYLAQQLSRAEAILACPEAEILVQEFLEDPAAPFHAEHRLSRIIRHSQEDYKLRTWDLQESQIKNIHSAATNLEAFITLLCAYRDRIKPSATIILFKAERLLALVNKIRETAQGEYPLHFISMIRDVRAVYASQKSTPMLPGDKPMSKNPVKTAMQWKHFVSATLTLKNKGNVLCLSYENLVTDIAGTLNNLLASLVLKGTNLSDNSMKDLSHVMPDDQKAIHSNITSPPIAGKMVEWKDVLSDREVFTCQAITKKMMHELGYQPVPLPMKYNLLYLVFPWSMIYYYARNVLKKIAFHIQ